MSAGSRRPSRCDRTGLGQAWEVRWTAAPFASAFWIVDQLSEWHEIGADAAYRRHFRERFGVRPGDDEALRDYARIRRAASRDPEDDAEPDVALPYDILPPKTDAASRFARAFVCAEGPREAAASLGLGPEDGRRLEEIFAQFGPRIDELLASSTFLARAHAKLVALADRAQMDAFLETAARFFGTREAVESPLYVDLVWGPPGSSKATVFEGHMLVPISEATEKDPGELASWLGVTVHEFGHHFLSLAADDVRARTSNRIVGTAGILRQRHPNVVDEATQAALGNILFMRSRLPEHHDGRQHYSFEPRLEYPDAIDSLARAVEPHLRAHLGTPGAFSGPFLEAALSEQQRLFPPKPAHFARVAIVLHGKDAKRFFKGMFWGSSRWMLSLDDVGRFAELSAAGPTMSRWVALTAAELEADPGLASKIEMPHLESAMHRIRKGRAAGCIVAARRSGGLGLDVAVVGHDADGLRRTLIMAERAQSIPTKPLCTEPGRRDAGFPEAPSAG